jgi:fibronectin type 3 domain-containing protein
MGGSCLTSAGLHVAILSGAASANSAAYKVYRGTASAGGPYTGLASAGNATTYTGTTVVSGQTYFYVVTAFFTWSPP